MEAEVINAEPFAFASAPKRRKYERLMASVDVAYERRAI
jgi:hypothetical protein